MAEADHLPRVFDGDPGLGRLLVLVDGRWLRLLPLAPGQEATLDLAGALRPGAANTVTLLALGWRPGSAAVVLGDS